jgi:hypothetical protein
LRFKEINRVRRYRKGFPRLAQRRSSLTFLFYENQTYEREIPRLEAALAALKQRGASLADESLSELTQAIQAVQREIVRMDAKQKVAAKRSVPVADVPRASFDIFAGLEQRQQLVERARPL